MVQITYWMGTSCNTTTVPTDIALETASIVRENGGQIVHYVAVS